MEHDLSLLPASDMTETEEKMRYLLYESLAVLEDE